MIRGMFPENGTPNLEFLEELFHRLLEIFRAVVDESRRLTDVAFTRSPPHHASAVGFNVSRDTEARQVISPLHCFVKSKATTEICIRGVRNQLSRAWIWRVVVVFRGGSEHFSKEIVGTGEASFAFLFEKQVSQRFTGWGKISLVFLEPIGCAREHSVKIPLPFLFAKRERGIIFQKVFRMVFLVIIFFHCGVDAGGGGKPPLMRLYDGGSLFFGQGSRTMKALRRASTSSGIVEVLFHRFSSISMAYLPPTAVCSKLSRYTRRCCA